MNDCGYDKPCIKQQFDISHLVCRSIYRDKPCIKQQFDTSYLVCRSIYRDKPCIKQQFHISHLVCRSIISQFLGKLTTLENINCKIKVGRKVSLFHITLPCKYTQVTCLQIDNQIHN